MAELVDAQGLGPCFLREVGVQVPSPAPDYGFGISDEILGQLWIGIFSDWERYASCRNKK